MKPYLVSLSISRELIEKTTSSEGDVSIVHESESGFTLNMTVASSETSDLMQLGRLRVRIEGQPQSLPPMNPDQMMDWILAALKKMI